MIGCLFFFFCLQTYEASSTRLGVIDELGLRQIDASTGAYTYPFAEFQEVAETAEQAVREKADEYGRGTSQILAWVPAYDNYDGSEKFWRHYELSLLDGAQKERLNEDGYVRADELDVEEWAYVWSVMIYYSVLVIGGNELQPAQQGELAFVVGMNITGLIFLTWISGEIAVLIAQLGAKNLDLQDAIDTVNTAMKNAKLSLELQEEIRDYFLKVQGTMAQQEELNEFFD